MNRIQIQWLVSSLIAVLIFAFIACGGASLIGFGTFGYAYHKLAVAKAEDKALATVKVVKAESKADVTVAKIKAEETVKVGLAENNADKRIAEKTASDALDAAKKAGLDAETLKVKLETARLEKEKAAQDRLDEAKHELEILREKLSRKPEVILVPTAVPTACIAPVSAPVVESVPVAPVIVTESTGHSYHSGDNPQTWQEAITNFLRMATVHGNQKDAATFKAALDGHLNGEQASFLRQLAARHPGDSRFIEQALAFSNHSR